MCCVILHNPSPHPLGLSLLIGCTHPNRVAKSNRRACPSGQASTAVSSLEGSIAAWLAKAVRRQQGLVRAAESSPALIVSRRVAGRLELSPHPYVDAQGYSVEAKLLPQGLSEEAERGGWERVATGHECDEARRPGGDLRDITHPQNLVGAAVRRISLGGLQTTQTVNLYRVLPYSIPTVCISNILATSSIYRCT